MQEEKEERGLRTERREEKTNNTEGELIQLAFYSNKYISITVYLLSHLELKLPVARAKLQLEGS
jgi:hypothetical protein